MSCSNDDSGIRKEGSVSFLYFISVTSYSLNSGIHFYYSWWDSGGNDVSHLSWHIERTCCSALLQSLLPWTVSAGVEIWVFLLPLLQVCTLNSEYKIWTCLLFRGMVWEERKEVVCVIITTHFLLSVNNLTLLFNSI